MASDTPLTHRAYQHIQSEILAGKLSAGTQISETRIAEQLGISRTPVGEAIRTLAAEGWVEQQPRRGTVVRSFSRREIIELYELREALETFAARKAADLGLGEGIPGRRQGAGHGHGEEQEVGHEDAGILFLDGSRDFYERRRENRVARRVHRPDQGGIAAWLRAEQGGV